MYKVSHPVDTESGTSLTQQDTDVLNENVLTNHDHNFGHGEKSNTTDTNKDESHSISVVVSSINKLLRWSPKPMHRKRSKEGNGQESTGSDCSEMNSDSPGSKNYSPPNSKRSSCPSLSHDEADENLKVITSVTDTNVLESQIILESNQPDENRPPFSAYSADNVGERSKGSNSARSSTKSSGSREESPAISRSSSLKMKRLSDPNLSKLNSSNSRTSTDSSSVLRTHSRERSFEKSLDNILDKCSDRSLDFGVGLDTSSSKNGVISDHAKTDDGSTGKKKKKSAPWYTMWSPSYKSRTEEFKKLFKDVPGDERLLVDYSCALQKDILVHGRMFVTQNWLCFYANIFRWETVLTIPCKKITAVTKERTARVIPNAIQIVMDREKYFFTSFSARDKTYLMVFRIWQNALLDQPMNPRELWQWVHFSYGEELGLTSSDDDYIAPALGEDGENRDEDNNVTDLKDLEESSLLSVSACSNMAEGEVLYDNEEEKQENNLEDIPTDMSDETEDSDGEFICGSDHTHLNKQPLNVVYNVPVDHLYGLIFADNQNQFLQKVHNEKKNRDLQITPWEEDPSDGNKHRSVSYTLALNYTIGPKSADTVENQTFYKISKPGKFYLFDAESTMAGIPYGDAFNVINRFCLTRITKHKCRLRLTMETKYKKSVWGVAKNLIEKNSVHGCTDFWSCVDKHIKHEHVDIATEPRTTQSTAAKRKVRKRRARLGQASTDNVNHKSIKPVISRHLSHMDPGSSRKPSQSTSTPIHSISHKEEKGGQFNTDLLTRVILLILVFLVIFNAVLFYKLWSLEDVTANMYSSHLYTGAIHIDKYPKTSDEWTSLLNQQQQLHTEEIDKWKDVLTSSIQLIDQMKSTLSQLRESLDHRHTPHDIYTDTTGDR